MTDRLAVPWTASPGQIPTANPGTEQVNLDTLLPQHYQFTYDGRSYVLDEPSEGVKAEYHFSQFKGARLEGEKVHVSMDRAAEAPSLMVSLCLRDITDTEKGVRVPQAKVKQFGGRLVKFLDEKSREMGGMADSQEQLEKQFPLLVEKLLKLSKNDSEKQQWVDWMAEQVAKVAKIADPQGSTEDQAKN